MRIESLSIERYGIHADRRFDFAPGLQVIYGPNEAGKTTLLQLVRDLFFGFKDRHPYKFEEHAGPLKAAAVCETREGRRFSFFRQKGRPDLVTGEFSGTRESIDADKLERLLGGISPSTYPQIFAFSIDELRKGGELLKEAGLHRALFGVGMGGLPQLQALQQRVQKVQSELLNTHGAAKKQVINGLLDQIQKAKETHKQSLLRPQEYTRQLDNLHHLEQQVLAVRARLEELRQEQHRLQRYQRAVPIQRECALLRETLSGLPQPGSFPADAVERYAKLLERQREVDAELVRLDEESTTAPDTAETEIDDERLLKAAGEIRSLQGKHAALANQAEKQKSLQDRIAQGRRDLEATLRSLPSGWSSERLSMFDHATPDVELLEQIVRATGQLGQKQESIETESTRLNAKIEELNQKLLSAPEDHRLPALESLLESREQEWKSRTRLKQVQHEISRLCDELEVQRKVLASGVTWTVAPPDDMESLIDVATPLPSAVAEFEREWAQLGAERDDLAATLKRQQLELKTVVRKLEELQRVREIPDPAQLPLLRAKRDVLWTDLSRHLTSPTTSASPAPIAGLVNDFQQVIHDCDALVDDLLQSAEDVAHRSRLQAEIAQLHQSLDESAAGIAQNEQSQSALQARWKGFWEPTGVAPHPPAVMWDWLSRLDAFRELHAELLANERDELEREAEVAGTHRELNRAFDKAVDFDDAWRQAQSLRDELRENRSLRSRLLDEHHAASGQVSALESQRFDMTLKLVELQQRGLAIAQRYEFPSDWDCEVSLRSLEALRDASRRRNELAEWESLVAEQSQQWGRFREELAELINRVAPDLDSTASKSLVALETRLQAAESRVERRRQLEDRRTHAEHDRLVAHRRQLETIEQIDRLASACGVASTELQTFVQQVAAASESQARLTALQGHLATILQAGESEEVLAEQDLDRIAARLSGIESDIRLAQDEQNAAQQQVGVLRHALLQWEDDEKPLRAAAEIASLQARLAHAVDQWVPLALADALMTSARERFQKLHQPRLIAEVERLFSRMTNGEYQQIVCSLDQDEEEPISVRHRSGRLRTTSQLSAGTSEQLYLAIRLAYVADYSRLSEPLPMVMDDVLVNFDEGRALQTLELLVELAESSQILFLTCHRRTIDLLRQLQADAPIIELNGSLSRLDVDVPLHAEVQHDHELQKSQRRAKRRVDRPDQPVLFPPNN